MREETSNTPARFGVMYVMAMFRNELIVCVVVNVLDQYFFFVFLF